MEKLSFDLSLKIGHNLTPDIRRKCSKLKCPFLQEVYPDFPNKGIFLCNVLSTHCALSNRSNFSDPENTKDILEWYFQSYSTIPKEAIPLKCPLEYYMEI